MEISDEMKAICNLQLGKLLFFYTDNFELAKNHLQCAYDKMSAMGTFYTRDKMNAISMLADLHIHYQQWPLTSIKATIRHEITTTRGFPALSNKLMFQLIELMKIDKDVEGAIEMCQLAINSSHADPKMELYFRIAKTLVTYQLMHEEPDISDVTRIGSMIKVMENSTTSDKAHLECIKDFYVCTKLAYMFYEGKSRTSRQLLRQIQKSQTSGETKIHGIRWLGEPSITLLACVMNQICALVQSNTDRVEKYYHLVIKHADEIIFKSTRSPQEPGVVRCINMIKMTTLEMMACCNVLACRPQKTLHNVRDMLEWSNRTSGPLLTRYFTPHIHYILGLQCCYFRQHENAENHFRAAMKKLHKEDITAHNTMALLNLNLAITYLNQLKMADYYEVSENLTAPKISSCSQMHKNNVKLLSAFFAYITNKLNECKLLSHEVLDDSKAEDFFRLHGLGLLLLSLVTDVDEKGVRPTVDWSKKSHDHVVILFSHSLYEKILLAAGYDPKSELMKMVVSEQLASRRMLSVENLTPLVANMPASKLLQWFDGDPFKLLPRDETVL